MLHGRLHGRLKLAARLNQIIRAASASEPHWRSLVVVGVLVYFPDIFTA